MIGNNSLTWCAISFYNKTEKRFFLINLLKLYLQSNNFVYLQIDLLEIKI